MEKNFSKVEVVETFLESLDVSHSESFDSLREQLNYMFKSDYNKFRLLYIAARIYRLMLIEHEYLYGKSV